MDHSTSLPEPPSLRSPIASIALRRLFAASLAALFVVAFAWPDKAATPRPTEASRHARIVIHDDLLNEGFSWGWPEHLVDATQMFQCWPTAERRTPDSLAVWADGENHVVAFSTALEGAPLPAYAQGLHGAARLDASQPIQLADRRQIIEASVDGHVLQLEGSRLSCAATWDD